MLPAGPKRGYNGILPEIDDPVEFYETCTGRTLYTWQREELRLLLSPDRPGSYYIQVGRKNGKSALGAAAAICEARKPNRHIYCIADNEKNLDAALMQELREIINQSIVLKSTFVIFKNHIEVPSTGSFIKTRANNFSASQSINPHMVLFDEVHLQKSHHVWQGMKMAGAAREDAILIGITTPGLDLAAPAHEFYEAVSAGKMRGRIFEPGTSEDPYNDREAWIDANPRLVDDPNFIIKLEEDFNDPAMNEVAFKRFRLGMWTSGENAWLPYGAWDACGSRRGQPAEGTRIVLGFDGSFSGDSTALIGATVGEEYPYVFVVGCWENPGKQGWRVPREAVHAAVDHAFKRYRVQAMYCDPPYWLREIEEWSQIYGKDKVLEFPTGSAQRFAPLCTTFYAGVMERQLQHDGDKRLARHLNNCVTRPTQHGDVITKPDPNSPAKIDLAVGAALAYGHAATSLKRRSPLVLL